MQEALTLFDSICNSRWFVKTSIVKAFQLLQFPYLIKSTRFCSWIKSISLLRSCLSLHSRITSLTTLEAVTTTRPVITSSTGLSVWTRVRLPNKSTHITPVPPTPNKSNVRLLFSSSLFKIWVFLLVVLSAIQDILLQLHLRECGLLWRQERWRHWTILFNLDQYLHLLLVFLGWYLCTLTYSSARPTTTTWQNPFRAAYSSLLVNYLVLVVEGLPVLFNMTRYLFLPRTYLILFTIFQSFNFLIPW